TDANLTARQQDPEDTLWCHVCERENTLDCENPRMSAVSEHPRPSSGLGNSDSTQHLLSSPSASTKLVGH
uniref:Uncharacterized protein n=1 Tax=Aotus nancymaae TaxID=37293 RepID=A0A2K5DJZ5_AOTNA